MNAIQAQAVQFHPGKSQPSEPLLKFPTEDGSRIPYAVFSSQAVYELEQERIFRGPTWSFLGLEAEIPN
ncbi:MAG TPA: hypothetical protein VGE17_09180, partial [Methylophilus sp.]